MEIWHSGTIRTEFVEKWRVRGLRLRPFNTPGTKEIIRWQFEISESNPLWPELSQFLDKPYLFTNTSFTCEEISQADWCMAYAKHSIERLRPEGFGWHHEYYAEMCLNCGIGWRQIAPFRIKKEPKFGKNMFADFGSAFELFCTPAVLETFKKHGVCGFETQPIILHKEDHPAESLKQLMVAEVAAPAIAEDLVERECYKQTDCPVCGRTWHAHYTRGALPLKRAALNPSVDFHLTNEWFGNGRTARREILFSRRAVNLVLENGWKGIQFIPVNVL